MTIKSRHDDDNDDDKQSSHDDMMLGEGEEGRMRRGDWAGGVAYTIGHREVTSLITRLVITNVQRTDRDVYTCMASAPTPLGLNGREGGKEGEEGGGRRRKLVGKATILVRVKSELYYDDFNSN